MIDGGGPPNHPTARQRAVNLLFILALAAAGLFALAPAAPACELTDPSCAVEKTKETVEDAGNTVDQVDEAVEDTVDHTTEQVDETVSDTEKTVQDTVRDVAGPPGSTPTDPSTPKDTVKGGATEKGSRNPGRDSRSGSADRGESSSDPRPTVRAPATNPLSSPAGASHTDALGPATASQPVDLAQTPAEIAKLFVFPLLLSAIVVAFLLMEGRLDRSDPKLALAPLDTEMLSFD